MFIERTGTGSRTFLGLHGWSGDHRTFSPVIVGLPEDVSFYSADMPGCGKSEPPRQWTVDSVADSIAEAIYGLPTPVTLVGIAAVRFLVYGQRSALAIASTAWFLSICSRSCLGTSVFFFPNRRGLFFTQVRFAILWGDGSRTCPFVASASRIQR